MPLPPKIEESLLISAILRDLSVGNYVILPHARIRCSERNVAAADIENALEKGRRIKSRDRYNERLKSWSYAYEGKTIDGDKLRVIVSFLNKLAIVTVIKLENIYE